MKMDRPNEQRVRAIPSTMRFQARAENDANVRESLLSSSLSCLFCHVSVLFVLAHCTLEERDGD